MPQCISSVRGPRVAQFGAVDPTAFLAPYGDIRPAEWPPEALTAQDVEQDELDMRYNKMLAALRDRLTARGPGRLAAAFRDLDRDGSGMLSRRDFLAVLRSLNLGGPELLDERVIDLILAGVHTGGRGMARPATGASQMSGHRLPAVPAGGGGVKSAPGGQRHQQPHQSPLQSQIQQQCVAYGDFVNALRFGSLPWRGYNRKLRHRMGADPDAPIGPPVLARPPYGVAYGHGPSGPTVTSPANPARAPPPWGEDPDMVVQRHSEDRDDGYLGPRADPRSAERALVLPGIRDAAGVQDGADLEGWPDLQPHSGRAAVLQWLHDADTAGGRA
ncbi:hypothetical protein GPECTOR_5g109 [Gonium pectorale]|uniref:EF-hand domain-containing protein n=1 Tax=Gonium pectorale TaxID=33097 RepID=A0A150GVT9_GONPE|nr:hypothetical protein GPECTOR_5g109 [Gonium pectorale]|eukprot:KXZ53997.1 hypothetical protein GPECTOR_5g109 [Gonium pectorale]